MARILILSFFVLFTFPNSYSQAPSTIDFNSGHPGVIENRIDISVSAALATDLHLTSGQKMKFQSSQIVVNHSNIMAGEIELHGASSLNFPRKSYSIKLPEKVPLTRGDDTVFLKKFYAISMNMDKDYVRNNIGMEVLKKFNMQVPWHCYSNLVVNDSSEGVYMVYYPPANFAIDVCRSPLVMRRGYMEKIENVHTNDIDPKIEKSMKKDFNKIYRRIIGSNSGNILYRKLSEKIDLEHYFDWLAFNYIFKNGDYTDEIYFYWDPTIKKFRLIPWDLDDLFQNIPHEGEALKEERIGDKLLFSSEDRLDREIANDPVLYDAYLKEFRSFLTRFTAGDFQTILEKVYREVYPYYQVSEIIGRSRFDKYGLTSTTRLQADLNKISQSVSLRMFQINNALVKMGY